MDIIDNEIKKYIASDRASAGLGRRSIEAYPTAQDLYLFLTDQMAPEELARMIDHLKGHEDDQVFVASVRGLISRMSEAESQEVPLEVLAKAKLLVPGKGTASCPYCHKTITPFKKPLARQKLINALWLLGGAALFSLSFFDRMHFVQWTVFGALCILKWIMDQRITKTQIMVYKALSEETPEKTRHLHRQDSHL